MLWFKKKKEPSKIEEAPEKPKTILATKYVYLNDQENADRFFRCYKDELNENDEYNEKNKTLTEWYYYQKVFKYDPFELPYKIEDGIVYSQIEDSWLKVGTIKRRIPEGSPLYLFPNIYKYVKDGDVEAITDDHYFGFEIEYKKKVGI